MKKWNSENGQKLIAVTETQEKDSNFNLVCMKVVSPRPAANPYKALFREQTTPKQAGALKAVLDRNEEIKDELKEVKNDIGNEIKGVQDELEETSKLHDQWLERFNNATIQNLSLRAEANQQIKAKRTAKSAGQQIRKCLVENKTERKNEKDFEDFMQTVV